METRTGVAVAAGAARADMLLEDAASRVSDKDSALADAKADVSALAVTSAAWRRLLHQVEEALPEIGTDDTPRRAGAEIAVTEALEAGDGNSAAADRIAHFVRLGLEAQDRETGPQREARSLAAELGTSASMLEDPSASARRREAMERRARLQLYQARPAAPKLRPKLSVIFDYEPVYDFDKR